MHFIDHIPFAIAVISKGKLLYRLLISTSALSFSRHFLGIQLVGYVHGG